MLDQYKIFMINKKLRSSPFEPKIFFLKHTKTKKKTSQPGVFPDEAGLLSGGDRSCCGGGGAIGRDHLIIAGELGATPHRTRRGLARDVHSIRDVFSSVFLCLG